MQLVEYFNSMKVSLSEALLASQMPHMEGRHAALMTAHTLKQAISQHRTQQEGDGAAIEMFSAK